jgi:hypothetical protein
MNIKITAEEAQKIINSQRKEISKLRGRLLRAHVCTSYLTHDELWMSEIEINRAIEVLKSKLLDYEIYDSVNEDELSKLIQMFEDLRKD